MTTSFDLLLSLVILFFGLQAFADGKSTYRQMSQIPKVKQIRKIAEESLELEPPCGEVGSLRFCYTLLVLLSITFVWSTGYRL